MDIFKSKPRRRRSKSGKTWPKWLRHPRLLWLVLSIGRTAYRLYRWWRLLSSPIDG